MLKAFFDESGKNEPCCVVAGYFGGENQWVKLARAWQRVIRCEGVSEFHAKNFWPRKGEFEGWDGPRSKRFIDELLRIIEGVRIYPVAAAIALREWDALPLVERRFLTGATFRGNKLITSGKPSQRLFLPLHHCFICPVHYCKPGIVLSYAFDMDKENEGWKASLYSQIRNRDVSAEQRNKMGRELGLFDSVDSPEIQAADLLAWEVHRYGTEAMENPAVRGRAEYRRAIRNLRDERDFEIYDKPKIDSMLAYFRERYAGRRLRVLVSPKAKG